MYIQRIEQYLREKQFKKCIPVISSKSENIKIAIPDACYIYKKN